MADEPAGDEPSDEQGTPPERPSEDERQPLVQPRASNRKLNVSLAAAGLCALIAVNGYFILRAANRTPPNVAPSASAPALSKPQPNLEAARPAASALAPAPTEKADADPGFDEEGAEESAPVKPRKPKHFATVQEAAAGSCNTASVEGLSKQIIEQSRCINPNAFVPLPSRPNLVVANNVFPYMELSARDHLLRALDSRKDGTMTIHSALRTVAQQYLAYRWSAGKRCGVELATPPGESNHETGLALDIAESGQWRQTLEAHDFKWLGAIDRVHFDFKGATTNTAPSAGSNPRKATDVLAFQQLWNKNHPEAPLEENGRYGPATEQSLKKSPPDGFKIGPSCPKRRSAPTRNRH